MRAMISFKYFSRFFLNQWKRKKMEFFLPAPPDRQRRGAAWPGASTAHGPHGPRRVLRNIFAAGDRKAQEGPSNPARRKPLREENRFF